MPYLVAVDSAGDAWVRNLRLSRPEYKDFSQIRTPQKSPAFPWTLYPATLALPEALGKHHTLHIPTEGYT